MQKLRAFLLAGLLAAIPFMGFALPVHAVDIGSGLDDIGDQAELSDAELPEVIGTLIKVFLSILGIIFLILTLYAGFLWMTAAGNDDKIAQAKKIMVAVVVGAAIIFSAWAITKFVIGGLSDATGAGVDIE